MNIPMMSSKKFVMQKFGGFLNEMQVTCQKIYNTNDKYKMHDRLRDLGQFLDLTFLFIYICFGFKQVKMQYFSRAGGLGWVS